MNLGTLLLPDMGSARSDSNFLKYLQNTSYAIKFLQGVHTQIPQKHHMPQNFFGAGKAQKGSSKIVVMPLNFASVFIVVPLGMAVIA